MENTWRIYKMKRLFPIAVVLFLISGYGRAREKDISGEVIIFHAGSLTVPLGEMTKSFQTEHPKVRVILESAGSLTCARKITELKKPCDVFASADYSVIRELLIPNHARWVIPFSGNEMTIVYHEKSRRRKEMAPGNWFDILLDENVSFGRSDPNSDPCGYRAIFTMKLAEKYYKKEGLAKRLQEKNKEYIRPKETDLLALLELGEIDYIFLYRSVAVQHGLQYLTLPDEINLRSSNYRDFYSIVDVRVTGKAPGSHITKVGAPMIYGVTIPKNAPNPKAALAFVAFLLDKDKGMKFLEKYGQHFTGPAATETLQYIPESLKKYARPFPESKGENPR